MTQKLIYLMVQLTLIILLAPLVNGIIKKVKAFSQKRKGPPLLQLYFDLYKLFKKDIVVSEASSWIFKVTPYVTFGSVLIASLFVPVSTKLTPISFAGDVILMVYVLAMGRFFMTLSGLDTGSTFGGMGSSREMMISSIIEPSLLVSFFTLGLIAKSTSIHEMMKISASAGLNIFQPVYILIFLAFLIILLAETARIPVDDPATHLELTMVHEAMLLEYSGRHLALMELAASIKQLILITLLANLFIPLDGMITIENSVLSIILSLGLYVGKVFFLAILVALVEINTVKLRLFSVPNLAALSFILAFLGFIQYFVIGR
ncbi:MAG: NADH-quinone oxidoreductase subunit H [Clostridia bacterium]|nr:NADH-quinone oxidoreductase subunit H [Clostridia bacterium]